MAIQEFNLGGGGVAAMYPLMSRYMETMSRNAEQIGGNIRSAMLQTEANTQTKDMAEQMGGLSLFNPDGSSKPDAMQSLFKIAAAHPLGSQTQAGKVMLESLGDQIKKTSPVPGMSSGEATPTAQYGLNGYGAQGQPQNAQTGDTGTPQGGSVEAPLPDNPDGTPPTSVNLITGQPGMEAGGAGPTVQATAPQPNPVSLLDQLGAHQTRLQSGYDAIQAKIASLNKGVWTEGNKVEKRMQINNLQNQASAAQTQIENNLARQQLAQEKADDMQRKKDNSTSKDDLAQQRIDQGQQKIDQGDQRIALEEKKSANAMTRFTTGEGRRQANAAIRPIELELANDNKALALAKKNFSDNSGWANTAVDSKTGKPDLEVRSNAAKEARKAQNDMATLMQSIEEKHQAIQDKLESLDVGKPEVDPVDKYVVGKKYKDAAGNESIYAGNGKWE